MGRAFGLEGFFASVAEKGHNVKQMFSMVRCAAHHFIICGFYSYFCSAAVKLQQAHQDMEAQEGPLSDEDAERVMTQGLSTIWKMGKFEVLIAHTTFVGVRGG